MSHSWEGPNGTKIMYNPDLSEVIVRVPYEAIEKDAWGRTVRIDGPDLLAFVADYVRRERVSALEDMDAEEILGVPLLPPAYTPKISQ